MRLAKIIIVVAIVIAISATTLFFLSNKTTLNINSTGPTGEADLTEQELREKSSIIIEVPLPNQQITSPLLIRGEARGFWFFEADAPAILVDENDNIIAQGHIQAQGEWMTEDFVFFEGKIIFDTDAKEGKLILEKANPSDLPENVDKIEIPVRF